MADTIMSCWRIASYLAAVKAKTHLLETIYCKNNFVVITYWWHEFHSITALVHQFHTKLHFMLAIAGMST